VTEVPTCVLCGRPSPDPAAYACERCGDEVARALQRVALVAGEITATVAKQCRTGGSGGRPARPDDEPATRDRPAGALVPMPLLANLGAADRHDAAVTALTTWVRHIAGERGWAPPWERAAECRHATCWWIRGRNVVGPLCLAATSDGHPLALAAHWLVEQLHWLRHRPEADQALTEILGAARTLERTVDRPADRVIVGQCRCDEYLYARAGAAMVRCTGCGETYDVEACRALLRERLAESLFTGAEIATLAMYLGHQGKRESTRNLIKVWAGRGLVVAHGEYAGAPAYRFGDVMARLASTRARA
jgi:hypothetical protein